MSLTFEYNDATAATHLIQLPAGRNVTRAEVMSMATRVETARAKADINRIHLTVPTEPCHDGWEIFNRQGQRVQCANLWPCYCGSTEEYKNEVLIRGEPKSVENVAAKYKELVATLKEQREAKADIAELTETRTKILQDIAALNKRLADLDAVLEHEHGRLDALGTEIADMIK